MSKRYQSIFGNGNKGNGDRPTGSLRDRISVPSSGHKTIDRYTPSKLRNCSPVESRAPEFTKEFRGEFSGDAVAGPRDRGPAPHSEVQDIILIAFELGSPTTSFLHFTIETSMLIVGDLRRQLACELKQTERLLYIFFGTTVLKDDSKILKERGLGRHFRALFIVIEPDDMNHTSRLRLWKDIPTREAADSKKDDRALDLQTTHNPFHGTDAKDLNRRILPGAALHQRSLPTRAMPQHTCGFRDTFNWVWPIHLERGNNPAARVAVLESSFRNLAMQPFKGQHPNSGILGITQYADISRLWEAWFCPGRRQHMRMTFRKWEWEKVRVCPVCQYDIEDFFRITHVQFDRTNFKLSFQHTMDVAEDEISGDGKGLASTEGGEAVIRNSTWDASSPIGVNEISEGSNVDLPLPSPNPENGADGTVAASDSPSTSSGEVSFVASTRSEDNIFNCDEELNTILLKLQEILTARVVEDYMYRAAENWGLKSRTQPASQSASDSQATLQAHEPNTAQGLQTSMTGGKRSRDSDDEKHRRKRKRNPRHPPQLPDTDSPPGLLFACPYSKSDPLRYSQLNPIEINYRGCSSRCLRDISRVKQHLYRVHRRPDHYCESCFQEFDTEDLLDTHSRQRPACEVSQSPFSEKMTQDQLDSIKRRKPGKDTRETWYYIFKILFPNAPLPDSPYYDTVSPMAVQSFSERFRSQAPPLLSAMVRDRTQSLSLGEYEQEILENALEESLDKVIQLFEADFDELEACITTMSSGNPKQSSNAHLNRNKSETGV